MWGIITTANTCLVEKIPVQWILVNAGIHFGAKTIYFSCFNEEKASGGQWGTMAGLNSCVPYVYRLSCRSLVWGLMSGLITRCHWCWLTCQKMLTLVLLVAHKFGEYIIMQKTWQITEPWQMGMPLKVLSESYPMNTNMIGFRWFSYISFLFFVQI